MIARSWGRGHDGLMSRREVETIRDIGFRLSLKRKGLGELRSESCSGISGLLLPARTDSAIEVETRSGREERPVRDTVYVGIVRIVPQDGQMREPTCPSSWLFISSFSTLQISSSASFTAFFRSRFAFTGLLRKFQENRVFRGGVVSQLEIHMDFHFEV